MKGIYRAEFVSALGSGCGTVYLENGIVRGGDSIIAYLGTYTVSGESIIAKLSLMQHGPGFSIFGDAKEINLDGNIHENIISGKAYVPNTGVEGKVVLKKIGEL